MNRSAKRKKLDDSDAFCSGGVVDVTLVLRRRTMCLYVTRYAVIECKNKRFSCIDQNFDFLIYLCI